MDLLLMADVLTSATTQGLGFANLLLLRRSNAFVSLSDSIPDQPPPSAPLLQISNSCRTLPRKRLTKRRRTKRKSFSEDDSDGSGGGAHEDADGPFNGGSGFFNGGGGGGGGDPGGRWGFGGNNSDDSSSWSHSGSRFAFDFIYEVIYWIALSNCVHFAFKKVLGSAADVVSDAERDKVPIRLITVC